MPIWQVKSYNFQEIYPPNRKGVVVATFQSEIEAKVCAYELTRALEWPSNQYMRYRVKKKYDC